MIPFSLEVFCLFWVAYVRPGVVLKYQDHHVVYRKKQVQNTLDDPGLYRESKYMTLVNVKMSSRMFYPYDFWSNKTFKIMHF